MLAVAAAVVLGLFLSTIVKSHAFTLDDKNEPHFETGTVAVSIGNVRSKPTLNSSVVYKLKAGDTVTFLKKRDEWYLIELEDGRLGWAHQSLFFKSHPDPAAAFSAEQEIKEIEFVMTPEGKEMVTFLLNGYYPPETFSDLGNNPTVICDFFNARLGKGVKRSLKVNGDCIYRIRTGIHIGSRPKVRVILDLVPDQTYDIRPVFFKDENLFVLIVKKMGQQ
ncbi:MAG: SH3 domain-containing protein [Deltaproteobacteria bacterium]|nr:SH3 domain-containing protein [Deltaproteobacteria bacterium]